MITIQSTIEERRNPVRDFIRRCRLPWSNFDLVKQLYEKRTKMLKEDKDAMSTFRFKSVEFAETFISNCIQSVYNFFHTIDSTFLCMKYPFLYPRNRFTGKHYTNWKLLERCKQIMQTNRISCPIALRKDDIDDLPKITTKALPFPLKQRMGGADTSKEDMYRYTIQNKGIDYCLYDDETKKYRLVKQDGRFMLYVPSIGWISSGKEIPWESGSVLNLSGDPNVYVWYFSYDINPLLEFWRKTLMFIHDYVLAAVFCVPTHSEIDALDTGWMRRFGMEMLDEIRNQLKKENCLHKYRIMQIKEKYGSLRWYDAMSSAEIQKIIAKYEDLSERTCISCGRPARYITGGYILPYCENCIDEYSKAMATEIDENGKTS